MTALPAQFIPQPKGPDVCPCERCPPGECEGIARVRLALVIGGERLAALSAVEDDPLGIFR